MASNITEVPLSDENVERFWRDIGHKPEGIIEDPSAFQEPHWIWTGKAFVRKRTKGDDAIQPYFYARTIKKSLTKVYVGRFAWRAFRLDLIFEDDWLVRLDTCEEPWCVNPWHFAKSDKVNWYQAKHGRPAGKLKLPSESDFIKGGK